MTTGTAAASVTGTQSRPAGRRAPSSRRWFVGLLAFLALALIEAAWTFGTPIGEAPDEPAHVLRAVSLWRGDVVPTHADPDHPGAFQVRTPWQTIDAVRSATCMKFHPTVTATCVNKVPTAAHVTSWQMSTAARYLPAYYGVVGWPTRIDPGRHGIFAMRLMSGLTCAVMLAGAVGTMTRMRRPLLPVIGIAAAITPMVTGIAAWVNPSAWEVSGGILLWAALLGLIGGQVAEGRRSLLVKVALGGSAVLLARQISVLWVVLIVITVAVLAGRPAVLRAVREGLHRPLAWAVALLLVGCAVVEQVWYSFIAITFGVPPTLHETLPNAAVKSLVHLPLWVSQTWGDLGWLDATAPLLGLLTWASVIGLLLMLAVLGSRGVLRWAVIGIVVTAALVSIGLEALLWNAVGGYWWQARYVMPYAMGLPLVCGVVGAAAWRWEARLGRAVLRWTVWPLGVWSALAFFTVLHRFAAGITGSWYPWRWAWHPPGGPYPLLLAATAGSLLLAGILVKAGSPRDDAPAPDALPDGVVLARADATAPDRLSPEPA